VNAVLLFFVLLAGLYSLAFPFGRPSEAESTPIPIQSDRVGERRPRAVRMSPPREIGGTETLLVEIRYGDEFSSSQFGIGGRGPEPDPLVNILFLAPDGSTRALLGQPGVIKQLLIPRFKGDSTRTWLAFAVAVEDTDEDGLLGENDLTQVIVTDLDGRRPRNALERPRRITRLGRLGTDLTISYLLPTDDPEANPEELAERMAVYRFGSETLEELDQLGATLQEVEQILAR